MNNYEDSNGNCDGSDGIDEQKVGCADDEHDHAAHLLPIVNVSDQLKSKYNYIFFCTQYLINIKHFNREAKEAENLGGV